MAQFSVDLQALWKKRSEADEFKLRDDAYRTFEAAFLARSKDNKKQYITWRPQVADTAGDSQQEKQMINLCRQIVNHHQSSFSRPPATWSVPYTSTGVKDALKKTSLINGILRLSRIKHLQPIQSWRLSARGDACYGIEWGKEGDRPWLKVRSYDPAHCYPSLDKEDIGGCQDMLISYEVAKDWAEKTFNVKLDGVKATARYFIYWTPTHRMIQVDDIKVTDDRYSFEHGLGFTPWRWTFNSPNGHMAQADICEIPKIQEMMSDSILLAMDAARRRIDKAYWGRGISGSVVPIPGSVVAFPNPQAHIEEFPTSDPPGMLQGVLQMLQGYAQAMGGISPISMEGFAGNSIVTGTAVRHQVEAIEARQETKRVSIEGTFGILGEYILRILEKVFPESEVTVALEKEGEVTMKGSDIKAWYTCEASYGGFQGMGPTERGRWALEGLGRIHDDFTAISIAYPDRDPETMVGALREFQLRQAAITGQSQVVAQQAAQGGSQPGAPGGGGGAPQPQMPGAQAPPPVAMNERPQPPGQSQVADAAGQPVVSISDLTSLLNVVRDRLKGAVWAVGELAITGSSATPRVLVEEKDDRAPVTFALQSKKVAVTVGKPGEDEPKMSLL